MEKSRGTKVIAIIALCIAVAGISLAYAALNTTLTIKGAAKVDPATWDIHFENLVTTGLMGTAEWATSGTPAISDSKITIESYDLIMHKPGDGVALTFDIKNAGTLDAELSDLSRDALSCTGTEGATKTEDEVKICGNGSDMPNNLTYTLKYTNAVTETQGTVKAAGADVAESDVLKAGQSVNVTLVVKYNDVAANTQSNDHMPKEDVTITVPDVTLYYEEA